MFVGLDDPFKVADDLESGDWLPRGWRRAGGGDQFALAEERAVSWDCRLASIVLGLVLIFASEESATDEKHCGPDRVKLAMIGCG